MGAVPEFGDRAGGLLCLPGPGGVGTTGEVSGVAGAVGGAYLRALCRGSLGFGEPALSSWGPGGLGGGAELLGCGDTLERSGWGWPPRRQWVRGGD
ncbi:hypothetical protein NDU88_004825 [Pleurodeles waltl]|uniref:Uncharacterized protein n=1 Tax=Pleurodeles waltl TaxID=8319 RepID=A0AAV7PKX5_PLEWA|nr:hypothetical protein NDU88_004825 [Pleurodeles waltl]